MEQIARVRVRERVPDWVVRRADQIEFIDASPAQLRHRLQQGEIYPAGQVSQALTHFFRADNLAALRELALRFLADEPAEDFARHLARLRARARSGSAERMLVGVTPAPGAEAMVRRWQELIGGGSIVGSVSRLAGRAGIDVHIMAVRQAAP